jgi:hypothetical protein
MNTETQDYDFMQKVADAYQRPGTELSGSLRAVALKFGITRTKVRKILITLGVLESPLPEEALQFQKSGMGLQEISERLGIPISTLSTYLPYVTVMYNGEMRSANAMRIGTFRERLATIAQMHHHPKDNHPTSSTLTPPFEAIRDLFTKTKLQETPMSKANDFLVMHLKLELNLDGLPKMDRETLRQYCDVKNGYSREILAPSDMTLHGLHYAIMQLFGWLNGHLRRFSLPDKVFHELTGERLDDYLDLIGVYFRMNIDPDDDDLFWDDDYDGGVSFKSWLRKRYTRPFHFLGKREQFMAAKKDAEVLRNEVRRGRLRQIIEERRLKNDIVKKIVGNSKDIMLEELRSCTDFTYGDLLERLKLSEILGTAPTGLKEIDQLRKKAKDYYEYNLNASGMKSLMGAKASMEDTWMPLTPVLAPITDTLNYEFDFCDGWEIRITCREMYYKSALEEVAPELAEKIHTVMRTGRPLCIAMDGSRQLVQDVGGIQGYCNFLRTVNGMDAKAKREMKEWASGLSWTGRKASPEKLL